MVEHLPDFSKKATDKAVLEATLQNPLTLFGAAAGILGGMATALFDGGILLSTVAASGAALSLFSFAINFFVRHQTIADRHIKKLYDELHQRKEAALAQIRSDLEQLGGISGAEDLVKQGKVQFAKSEQKYNNLENLLKQKLGESEMTFGRYLGTAEQVYLSILDNLTDIVMTLKAIQTIDLAYVEERKAALAKLATLTEADEQELKTLDQRIELRNSQIQKVNILLTQNEEAMTALDHTTASISGMKTIKGRADASLDTAMEELTNLANRASNYNRS